MKFQALSAAVLALLATSGSVDQVPDCPRQPLPAAVDFVGPWQHNMVMDSLTFAATPSLQSPSRAWLIRMHRFGPRDIKVNIVKLQSEPDCNRYRVERQWTAPISSSDYDQAVALVEPFVTPPGRLFSSRDHWADETVAADGTSLTLRTQTLGWTVSRHVHESSPTGKAMSAIFYRIVATHVPRGEMPTGDWREPRSIPHRSEKR